MRPMRCFVGPRYRLLPHVVCFGVRLLRRVRHTAIDDTRIMVTLSVCLCAWLVCSSVFFVKNLARIYVSVSLHVSRLCDAAYCYSIPHSVVCLSDFRHTYQHRPRGLLLRMLRVLGEASYLPHV